MLSPTTPIVNDETTSRVQFKPGDFAIDEYRPIRVAVIGAGISGIVAGIRYVLPRLFLVSAATEKDWLSSAYAGFRRKCRTYT